ncbi:hypothetical protein NKT34_22020 [Paenibacillus polysaccharolyticus]|uniref:hypothetical protein n=1 Tax=Paenibacillus polysaccharolyticus TaxID=582692 RepID=UPI00209FA566|nr:hypothetical protein [Paenibacillus polysaccharolyticus]MCP1135982.1 hypothetical protein [Paenibacillus polysaccharolyticus]
MKKEVSTDLLVLFYHTGEIYHGGGIVGFKNEIIRYVDDRITIIMLNNLSTTNVEQIRIDLTKMIFQA